MKKFDLAFERALHWLNEANEMNYTASTLFDNVYALVKLLSSKNNNYLINNKVKAEDDQSVKDFAKRVVEQETPEIVLDTNPPIKIIPSQMPDTEDFTIELFNLNKKVGDPTRSEKIVNEHNEVVFDKVINFITNATMKEASPEAAVNEMPQEENPAAAQPGAEQSELPGAEQSAAPPKV